MKRTKFCFIQSNAYSLFNSSSSSIHGGSELQLFLIAKELVKREDLEISFIVGDFGQESLEIYDNIKVYKSLSPQSSDNLLKKLLNAFRYWQLFKKVNCDIYFTSAANSTIGLVSLFCKLYSKKHIHRTAHVIDVDGSFARSNGLLGKLYEYGLTHANQIITQNKDHKKILRNKYNINAKVIKNSFVINDREDIAQKSFILWVARAEKWKNPELFIELAGDFPAESFTMICPATHENPDYQLLIKESSKSISNLKFIDRIPFSEIQKYFNQAKVFINTSDYEGFPNTFVQAGIAHTPIISLNVNPDNFINEYDCGYDCNGDKNILKNMLKNLLDDEVLWRKKSSNIFSYVKKNHDIKTNIKLIEQMIEELNSK